MHLEAAGPSSGDGGAIAPGTITRLLAELALAPDASVVPASAVGDRLGRFLLVREIGRGGFGLVFEAEDTHLRRRVAIKVLRPERGRAAGTLEWIQREGEAAARVHHPNVVTLHDVGQWEGGTYLVYELLEGETLTGRLERGSLERSEARRLLRSVAAGLAHMHAAGVVHRDLKPDNVFIETGGTVKILDLGLAQVAGAVGILAGSRPYGAPEQWRGDVVDARADVHAWGVLAHRLLAGSLPPPGATAVRARAGSLRALAASARSADPAARPADGSALIEALDRLDRRRRVRVAASVAAVLIAALGATSWISTAVRPRPPVAPGPFRVAVSDVENAAGDTPFDGLGDLVARGLQGSQRLQVIDRPRLEGILRASGRLAPERLDRGIAAFAARQAGAAAVVVPWVARDGDGHLLGLDALEPENGRRLFSVQVTAPAGQDPLDAVERLVSRGRAALQEREGEAREPVREVARVVSSSLEAHQRYFEGLRCVDRPSERASSSTSGCRRHFDAALAIDPEFPLAHFEIVRMAFFEAYPPDELRSLLDRALHRVDRLPASEQAQLRAWQAQFEGRSDEGVAILLAAARDFPEDPRLALALGELHYREGRSADAVGPLARAVELDPGLEMATEMLVWSLGLLDRVEDLRSLAGRLARSAPSTGTLRAESSARAWTGDVEGALAVARRAAPGGAGPARDLLEDALVAAGEWDEAEALLREDAEAGGDRAATRLERLLRMRGRVREAEALLARNPPPEDGRLRFVAGTRRAIRAAGTRDRLVVRQVVEETRAWSPPVATSLAPLLAYVGDVDAAEGLGREMHEGPGSAELLSCLVAWRRSGPVGVLPRFRELARASPAAVRGSLPPEATSWIAAEAAAEVALDAAALADVRRFQRFHYPLGAWRAWAYPRSLVLEARILDALGRPEEARVALGRFEALWARADRDEPLLADARALRRRLGAGGNGVAVAPDGRGR